MLWFGMKKVSKLPISYHFDRSILAINRKNEWHVLKDSSMHIKMLIIHVNKTYLCS